MSSTALRRIFYSKCLRGPCTTSSYLRSIWNVHKQPSPNSNLMEATNARLPGSTVVERCFSTSGSRMSSSTSPPMKLVYFNLRGRAEIIRYILKVSGVEFEDYRIEHDDWPERKPTTPTPSGQLPYLEMDGTLYTESLALARYFAQKYGLSGKTPMEELAANSVVQMADDLKNWAYLYMLSPVLTDEQRKTIKEKLSDERCPSAYGRFEKILAASASGYLVGDSLTIADLTLTDTNELIATEIPGFLDNYPKVIEHSKKIKATPKLAEYLASRKVTPF